YIKNLLDELGIEPINFRSHKYKSAGNMFSEKEMTAAEREVYDSILQSFYDQLVARVELGRGSKLVGSADAIINKGPYLLANDALQGGLVDDLIYEDQLDKQLKKDFKFSGKIAKMEEYRDYAWSKPKEHQIAVIYASGNIVMGKGTPGQKIALDTTVKLIRDARKNKAYKGIILRVDSGGGSAQASDIILRELELAQTENHLPVVVSMAGVAGSGGYYIACKADRIVADPATITGSIGVIGLVFNATEMFKKVRINWSTVKKGENADMGSLSRPWKENEKKMLTDMIEWTYEDFVKKVDDGRKPMNLEQVHQHAQGRIWTGAQALEIGLIDDLGGMDVALDNMRELTGITGKLKIVDATTSASGIYIEMGANPLQAFLPMKALGKMSEDYIQLYELWDDFGSDKALMYCPEVPEDIQF
ncbi:MAG: signal peptide peptidase SppA, partial [Candidatus Cloacimonas sp.]|nr:signal peptide peptidase SppA [Candidatus Cloacimonas sp.]